MDLNTSLQTDGKGPSRTIFINDSTILIRQNTYIVLYDITTKSKLQQIQIGEVYDDQPCGYLENKYIEVQEKIITEIDLKTQKKKTKKVHFEQYFDDPSSFQAGSSLYIFNNGHLYIVDLVNLTLAKGFVVPNARRATMTVLGPKQLGLYAFDEGSLQIIDTELLGCRKVFFNSPNNDGQIIGINLSELLVLGQCSDGTNSVGILKASLERQDEDLELATLEHQITGCQADVRGQRLALTDVSGRLHVFSFNFPCSYTENISQFSLKSTERWSAVSTVQKQGKHDIFCQQLQQQCEHLKKAVQSGKQKQMQSVYEETRATLKNLVEGVTQTKGTYLEVLTQLRGQLGVRADSMIQNVNRLRSQLKLQEQELENTVKLHREKQRDAVTDADRELLQKKKDEIIKRMQEVKNAEIAKIDLRIQQMRDALEAVDD